MMILDFSKNIRENCEGLIRRFWHEWFTTYRGREVLTVNEKSKDRAFLTSFIDFERYIILNQQKRASCYMSVQPFLSRNQVGSIEKLFFDFDCPENIEKARIEALKFAKTLQDFYDVIPLVVFSGCKGYHVYVWLQRKFNGLNNSELKQVYEIMQKTLLKGLKFKTLDWQVIGDIKRLARIPYTIHEKSGNLCVPIDLDGKPIIVISLEGYRKRGLPASFVEYCRKQIREKRSFNKLYKFKPKKNHGIRPCIIEASKKPLEGRNGHLMRLAIACELLSKGYTVGEVTRFFASQPDYSEEKTRYFVEHAYKSGYKPFKCETIRELGFCLKNGAHASYWRHASKQQMRD